MTNLSSRWSVLAALAASSVAACNVEVTHCDKTPDAEICNDDFGDDFDGGDAVQDGGTDGAVSTDASTDAGTDATTSGDAGNESDAGDDASVAATLTLDEFCTAQLARGYDWRDALDTQCGVREPQAQADFLAAYLAFPASTPTADQIDQCIAARKPAIDAHTVTFHGELAGACATAYAAQFPAPSLPFPLTGVDVGTLGGSLGHGAAGLAQIPACRAAFVGTLVRDAVCSNALECIDGLRCRAAAGGGKSCQSAIEGGVCTSSSECTDNFRCVGSTSSVSGGKTCVSKDQLPDIGGNCGADVECSAGNVCSDAGKCTPAVAQNICPTQG